MACLDHVCGTCGFAWMDNQRCLTPCPQCGGRMSNDFDEDIREDDQWDDEDDQDDAPEDEP